MLSISLYRPLLCVFATAIVFAQSDPLAPVITPGGLVNAASYAPSTFPGGAIAQGSLFTIFGKKLGPAVYVQANAYPLANNLSGVSIRVTQGSTSVDAVPFFVAAGQVSAIMPSNAPLGASTLVLSYNGKPSAQAKVTVVASSVGLFAINSGGSGPSVVQNYIPGPALPVNSRTSPAIRGQTLILYGTGLGASLNGDINPPQAGTLSAKTEIFVGGQPAAVSYSGRSPCCSGLDQFAFAIPQTAPLGCNVPVLVRTGSATASNTVTIAISADGSPCKEAAIPFGANTNAGSFGTVLLLRSALYVTSTTDATTDFLQAAFRKEPGGPFAFNPLFSGPPAGSCTTYNATGNLLAGASLPGFSTAAGGTLDAGTLTATVSTAKITFTPDSGNEYFGILGASTALPGFFLPILSAAPLSLSSPGGKDVGAFTVSSNPTPVITWTNRDQAATIPRSAGLTVTWSFPQGLPTPYLQQQVVLILGGVFDPVANSTGMFYCAASGADTSFTVPSYILSSLPASSAGASSPRSAVIVGTLPVQPVAKFTASGIDQGVVDMGSISSRFVIFQ